MFALVSLAEALDGRWIVSECAVIQDLVPADGSAGDIYEKRLLSQLDRFRAEDKSRVTMPGSHSLYIRSRRT